MVLVYLWLSLTQIFYSVLSSDPSLTLSSQADFKTTYSFKPLYSVAIHSNLLFQPTNHVPGSVMALEITKVRN